MNCKNCGRQNPSGSLYCQDCGHRLGDWVPPERPQKMPTPPTGIARQRDGAAAAPSMQVCPRCGSTNAAHMRFCNNCGFALEGLPGPSASPQAAPMAPYAFSPPPVVASGPVCWRCRAGGDSGAEFCKFCGARYADDPSRGAPAASPYAAPNGGHGAPALLPMQSPMGAGYTGGNQAGAGYAGANHPVGGHPVGGHPVGGPALVAPGHAGGGPPVGGPAFSPPAFGGHANGGQAAPFGGPAAISPPVHAPAAPRENHDPAPRAAVEGAPRALLIAILKDGSDGRVYPIHDEQTDIGRSEGHLVLADDPYLSARHARVVMRGDQLVLRDLDSVNGIFVRVREPVDVSDGDMILLGQQVMRFEVLSETELPLGPAMHRGVLVFGTPEVPRIARLVQYTTEGVGRDVHYLYRDETVIGREQGDIVCTDDPFMSRRHAAISIERSQRRFVLKDLGSSNGTAVRIRGERTLRAGDQFRIGRHLFRYDRPGSGDSAGGRAGA